MTHTSEQMKKLKDMTLQELKKELQKLVNQKYGRDLFWCDKFAMTELYIKEKEVNK